MLIHWQLHFLQKSSVARVAFQASQQRITFHFSEATIPLFVGVLQPVKGLIRLITVAGNLRNLDSPLILQFFEVFCKRSISFLTVFPLQLFAYSIAVRGGCDVDQLRNLAKSVTVSDNCSNYHREPIARVTCRGAIAGLDIY